MNVWAMVRNGGKGDGEVDGLIQLRVRMRLRVWFDMITTDHKCMAHDVVLEVSMVDQDVRLGQYRGKRQWEGMHGQEGEHSPTGCRSTNIKMVICCCHVNPKVRW